MSRLVHLVCKKGKIKHQTPLFMETCTEPEEENLVSQRKLITAVVILIISDLSFRIGRASSCKESLVYSVIKRVN